MEQIDRRMTIEVVALATENTMSANKGRTKKAVGGSTRKSRTTKRIRSKPKVDPITLSVIRGILETTQREMTLSLEKTARSSVFNLAHDYSTALFNHVPEMILQGQDIPIHLGSLIPAMKSVARYFGDDIHDGDLILHNDPAFGGSHAIDVCMYKPVFYKGKLRYWTVCKGHLTDIGGPVPAGYNPNATEIYAECLRIPPVKNLGPRQAAQRRDQSHLHQYARTPRPGRRFQCAYRRLPGGRAQSAR